jgi:creatinine amidohydrolase
MAARLLNVEHPHAVCMASWYLASAQSKELLAELRDSEPGGMAHACELETSLYLALEPELVGMDRAAREIPPRTAHVHMDWQDGPLSFMPHWSALSSSGVTGDPTLATAEKGRRWLARAQDEIAEYIAEVRERAHPVPVDHH